MFLYLCILIWIKLKPRSCSTFQSRPQWIHIKVRAIDKMDTDTTWKVLLYVDSCNYVCSTRYIISLRSINQNCSAARKCKKYLNNLGRFKSKYHISYPIYIIYTITNYSCNSTRTYIHIFRYFSCTHTKSTDNWLCFGLVKQIFFWPGISMQFRLIKMNSVALVPVYVRSALNSFHSLFIDLSIFHNWTDSIFYILCIWSLFKNIFSFVLLFCVSVMAFWTAS